MNPSERDEEYVARMQYKRKKTIEQEEHKKHRNALCDYHQPCPRQDDRTGKEPA